MWPSWWPSQGQIIVNKRSTYVLHVLQQWIVKTFYTSFWHRSNDLQYSESLQHEQIYTQYWHHEGLELDNKLTHDGKEIFIREKIRAMFRVVPISGFGLDPQYRRYSLVSKLDVWIRVVWHPCECQSCQVAILVTGDRQEMQGLQWSYFKHEDHTVVRKQQESCRRLLSLKNESGLTSL